MKSPRGNAYWQEAFQLLNDKLPKVEMTRWFSKVRYVSLNNEILTVSADSSFVQDQIKRKYGKLLQKFLEQASGRELALKVIVREPSHSSETPENSPAALSPKKRVVLL